MRSVELVLLVDLIRFGAATEARVRLTELARVHPVPSVWAALSLASGIEDDDPRHLNAASTSFESQGFFLLAAEAAAVEAQSWRRIGRVGTASTAGERLRRLLSRCPGARTPLIMAGEQDMLDPLSPREREIATLASNGLSSPAIAERLGLSERTVENHLSRVFVKLGIKSRRQLRR
jgi:DNA-binding CsgD family transcriptional regulator